VRAIRYHDQAGVSQQNGQAVPDGGEAPAADPYVRSLKMAVGAPARYQALPSGL
jgi:hypothetical protein